MAFRVGRRVVNEIACAELAGLVSECEYLDPEVKAAIGANKARIFQVDEEVQFVLIRGGKAA